MNEIEKEKNLMQSNKDIEIENEKVAEVLLEQKSGEKLDAQKVDSSDSDKNEASDAEKKIETMQVMIHPIPQKNRSTFEAMIQNLLVMHEEIENKQNLAHEQNRVIGERISLLVQKYDIEVNRSHYEHFVKSIATYMQLLHDILREFRDEVLLCRYVFALEEPKLYEMPINVDLESYKWFLGHDALTEEEINFLLLGKIQQVKRHIKTVKKDLRV
ncbi:hypothetical protein JKY79_01080, partial [Candidatus Babeliales bacterium]|nr:hypothetical protein [Candidatus Babeliales bacterium]